MSRRKRLCRFWRKPWHSIICILLSLCFRRLPDNFYRKILALSKIFEQHFKEMFNERPSDVSSILVVQDAKSGQFELAVGHDIAKRPIYRYSFEKQIWLKV